MITEDSRRYAHLRALTPEYIAPTLRPAEEIGKKSWESRSTAKKKHWVEGKGGHNNGQMKWGKRTMSLVDHALASISHNVLVALIPRSSPSLITTVFRKGILIRRQSNK